MKNTKIKIKQGFTLTELLVVIAILAILATVSIVGYNVFIDQAHQSIALQEMTQIRDALFNQDVINGDDFNLADGIFEADYLQNGAMGYFWSEALAVEEFVATLGMNGIFKVENGFCYYSPAGKNATAKLNVVTGEITTTSGALQGPHYPPNHVHRYQTVTTAPTCTLVGYTTNTCNACNYSFVNNYVSALGHAMDGDFCSVCGKGVSQGLLFEDIDENSYAVVGRGNCEDIDVVIPSTYNGKPVVSIGARAFENDNLQNVTIPNSVTSIYDRAFTGCSNLQSITIPNSVTYLDYGVFDGCLALITVALPNGIESIPVSTFVDCSNLQNVTIPNSVTSIGNTAFSNCTKLQSITMPQGVTTIESQAFRGCENLQTVTIPSSLDIIFSNAFYGCSQLQNIYISDLSAWCNISNIYNLMRFGSNDKKLYLNNQLVTELIIPNDVTTIQHEAFVNCKSIISVTLPEELESIENYILDGAFSGCERLVEVYNKSKHLTVKKGNYSNGSVGAYALSVTNFGEQFTSKLTNDNGFVVHTDGEQKVLVAYFGSKTNVVVPSYVTQINQFAFYNCQGIKSITIPNSVTSIGNSAFYGCSDLVSITIPNSVTSIGNSAFYGCSDLVSITIPNSVTSIGLFAFKDCTSLSSVVLGDQITSIYSDAFEGCENLQYNVKDDLKYLGNERNPYLFLFGVTTKDITTAQLDKNCKYMVESAFNGCRYLTSVELSNKLASIPSHAFRNCSSLQSITIPNSVTSIGRYAFYGCTGLQSITIPNSVTSIGYSAFEDCSSLASITIPNSVTSIGRFAFEGCTNLTNVVIGGKIDGIDNSTFTSCENLQYNVKDNLKYLGNERNPYLYLFGVTTEDITSAVVDKNCVGMIEGAFSSCISLTSVELSNQLTSIPTHAFYDCSSLQSITIPDGVTSIGDYAFYNCSSLQSITIPDSVTTIGSYAFYNCSSLQSITIPNSVTTIGSYAFYNCSSLQNITIPESVTAIGNSMLNNCTKLTKVVIYGKIDGIDTTTFSGCDNLQYNVKNYLRYLGNESNPYLYLFGATTKGATTVVVDENCKYMLGSAFKGCQYLTSVTLNNNLTSIPHYAFHDCTSLQSITIPDSVTSIGQYAFYNCSRLESITFKDTTTWYRTTGLEDIQTSVTDPSTNALYFSSLYNSDSWYKK